MKLAVALPKRHVLLVEDNLDDVILMRRALHKGGVDACLHVVENGEQALRYLNGDGEYADRSRHPVPSLLLLDWKLPLCSGEQVLRGVRERVALIGLPVVVLTSSDEREDVDCAYRAGASSFVRKPVEFAALVQLLQTLSLYWLLLNVPPLLEGG